MSVKFNNSRVLPVGGSLRIEADMKVVLHSASSKKPAGLKKPKARSLKIVNSIYHLTFEGFVKSITLKRPQVFSHGWKKTDYFGK
jgi:hypothetical protein